jgi:hypothetical protein
MLGKTFHILSYTQTPLLANCHDLWNDPCMCICNKKSVITVYVIVVETTEILEKNPKEDHMSPRNSVEIKQSIVVQLEVWKILRDKVKCTQ